MDTENEETARALIVRNLPDDVDEDDVADFFEHRRRGGFTVDRVELDQATASALVYFQEEEAVAKLLQLSPLEWKKRPLEVKSHLAELRQREEEARQRERENARALIVRNLPADVDDEDVADFFEHKKRGGFTVDRVELDQATASALVYFQEEEAVSKVIELGPLQWRKRQLEVKSHLAELRQREEEARQREREIARTLMVKGLPADLDEDDVADFFESKRRGGFTVDRVELDQATASAQVYFQEEEAVQSILQRGPYQMKKAPVEVKSFSAELEMQEKERQGRGEKDIPAQEAPRERLTPMQGEADAASAPSFVLEVTDLPESVDEDFLTNFFENRKNSGGYTVDKVEMNPAAKSSLVYFEDPSAVETVLKKAPFLMKKKQITVNAYTPKQREAEKSSREETESEEEETCVVAVRGLMETMSQDMLELYFENTRKSGGQDIQNISLDEKEEVTYITFESPEVAKRVASKTDHKLGGSPLRVSLFTPRPCYPDRVFLSGIPTEVSKESLVNYLEARAKLDPTDILYGEEEGTALVTFDTPFDLPTLEQALAKRPLGGSRLRASPVAVSDSVLVKGLPDGISQDTVELYFDNTRKSGGEDVQRVERVEGGAWVVHFAEPDVASRVSAHNHRVGGKDLQVSLYVECLGLGGGDSDPNTFSVPPPLQLSELDPFLLRFLREAPSQREALVKLLADRHARPQLADVTPPTLTVTCTLTREMRQGKRLAKTWTADVEAAVKEFLGHLKRKEVRMTSTVYKEVEKETDKFQSSRKEAAVYGETKSSTFVVVGLSGAVATAVTAINNLKQHLEAELEKKRQTITETDSTLKSHQLRFLQAINFPQKLKKELQGLQQMAIDLGTCKVTFMGLFGDVKNARIRTYECTQELRSSKKTVTVVVADLLKRDQMRDRIDAKLKEGKLVLVWEVLNQNVQVWAASDEAAVDAVKKITGMVQEQTIRLDPESLPLLKDKGWRTVKKTAEDGEACASIMVDEARKEMVIAALEVFIFEDIRNFFSENTVYHETLRFPPGRQRFLTEHLSSKIQELESNQAREKVRITFHKASSEFKLEGTRMGLERVVQGLQQLGATVLRQKHTLNEPGVAEFLASHRGKEVRSLVESSQRCIIRDEDDITDQPTVDSGAGRDGPGAGGQVYVLAPGRTLRITQANMTTLRVGAIVNAANENLRHRGGLAKAIAVQAGPSLEDECNQYIDNKGPLREGEVMVSGAGSLPCQKVIHAVGPRYQGGQDGEEDRLKAAITGSLQAAQSCALSSIAIPAISSGNLGYPVKEATQVIVETVVEFFRDNASSSLQEVHLCDNSSSTLTHFHGAAAKLLTPVNPGAAGGAASTSTGPGTVPGLVISLGEMATQQADVLVNTTSSSLNLSQGAVSKSLLKAGGQQLQQEVSSRYPQGLPADQLFAVTSGGRLRVKSIFHTSLPDWGSYGEKFLHKLVEESIKEADGNGFCSIAFPVLGTGVLKYPRDVVARCFQETTSRLLPSCRSLREVRIVIFPSDQASVKAFSHLMGGADHTGKSASQSLPQASPAPSPTPSPVSRTTRRFSSQPQSPAGAASASMEAQTFHLGDITVQVKQGNLLEETVTFIVNPSNPDLDLNKGEVSKAIREKCGTDIEDACKSKDKKKITKKGIMTTPAPNLPCKSIVHLNMEHFRDDLKKGIVDCVKKADKEGATSIAFPALRTDGIWKPEDSARCFVEAIRDMLKSGSKLKAVRDVRVVILDSDLFAPFASTIQSVLETADAQKEGWWSRMFGLFSGSSPKQELASVSIFVFSDSDSEIKKAVEQIRKLHTAEITTQPISHSVIKDLSPFQIKALQELQAHHQVSVTIDSGNASLEIKGLHRNVSEALLSVYTILQKAEKFLRESETAETVATYVQWCVVEEVDGQESRIKYDERINAMIEQASKNKENSVRITDSEGVVYIVDLQQMVEYPEDDSSNVAKVIRETTGEKGDLSALPQAWTDMADAEDFKRVALNSADPDFTRVQAEWTKTIGSAQASIASIERIQNRTLYKQYSHKLQAMDKHFPNRQNERLLWFGTNPGNIDSINMNGFNRSRIGEDGPNGKGVYFAVKAEAAADASRSPASNGKRCMYLARVLTGDFTANSDPTLIVPPSKSPGVLFDSAVDDSANPSVFVVFHDVQAYPEFLVHFT